MLRIFSILNNKESDLKQTGQDYINRCNNLTESAVNLINNLFTIEQTKISIATGKKDNPEFDEQLKEFNSTIKNKIAEIEQHKLLLIETLGKLDPATQEDHHLAIQAFQELNSTLADHLLNLETTIPKLTNKTVDNKLSDLKYFTNKQPSLFQKLTKKKDDKISHKTPEDWIKILQLHEARFDASKERDIVFHVYHDPAEQDSAKKLWVIDGNIPFSNLPSTVRDGTDELLSNWWRSTTTLLKVDNGNATVVDSFTAERSSSFSAIDKKNKAERQVINKKIAENKLRTLVRNKIVETINKHAHDPNFQFNNKDLYDACFNHEILVMTLLNLPLNKIMQHTSIPLIHKAFDESNQLEDTVRAFSEVNKKLHLTEDDIDYIKKHVAHQHMTAFDIDALKERNITHTTVFHNFASSSLRGFSSEEKFNKPGLDKITTYVVEYFSKNCPGTIPPAMFQNFNLVELNKAYNNPKLLSDDKKILSMYIKYVDLIQKESMDPSDNFLRQVFSALLMKNLGKEIHVTCKSGEDRTGATFVAINCSLVELAKLNQNQENFNIHDPKQWESFKKNFWDNYANIEHFSASREITNFNAVGARGLQSQSVGKFGKQVSPVHRDLIVSNHMARISKQAFKKYIPQSARKLLNMLSPTSLGRSDSPVIFSDLKSDKEEKTTQLKHNGRTKF